MASSAIDVSDGLAKELHLLAKMSGVGVEVYPDKLPVGEGVKKVAGLLGLDPIELVLASGEEFELVFTIKPELAKELGIEFSVIGRVVEGNGVYAIVDGKKRKIPPLGWEHLGNPKPITPDIK